MKLFVIAILLLVSFSSYGQVQDTTNYPKYITIDDGKGVRQVKVAFPPQILIIDGDSMYTVPNEVLLRKHLSSQEGFDIINDEDAIDKILRQRIRSVVIIKKKKKGEH